MNHLIYFAADAILGSIGISSKSSWKVTVTLDKMDQWKCNYLRTDTFTKRCWKACLFGCKVCDTDENEGVEFQNSICVTEKKDLLEVTRSNIETADNYGTGYDTTEKGNAAILNPNRGKIPNPQIADIVGKVTYNADGSGATLQTKFIGSTKVLDNGADSGYSSMSNTFETQELELDFTPSSVSGSRRRLSNGVNTSQALLDSLTGAVGVTESLVNMTVNKDMSGIDQKVKQFAGQELEPLILALASNNKELEVSCAAFPSTFARRPYIESYDGDCGSPTTLMSASALTNKRIGASPVVPAKYSCGSIKVTRRWTVKDRCEDTTGGGTRQSIVDQVIYMEPKAPIWTLVPWQLPVSLSASQKISVLNLLETSLILFVML